MSNPRCYPPRSQELLDVANDGTYIDGRRNALLAHQRPDVTASSLDALTSGLQRGTIPHEVALRRINELLNPPLNPAQRARFQDAETAEERAARLAKAQAGLLPAGALSLEEVEQHCRRRGPTDWYCYTQWPGGWVPAGHPAIAGNPAWAGPTPYGELLPECFGFTRDRLDRLGTQIIERLTGRRTGPIAPPPTTTARITPAAPPPAIPPPPPVLPPPGTPYLRCQQVNLYGIAFGDVIEGYATDPAIIAVNGVFPWACAAIRAPG